MEAGSQVRLHFSLALASGELVDSNFDKAPPSFVVGDGSLLPGFEACLMGLRAGDQEEFLLPPEQAFGAPNDANCQSFTVDRFRHLLEDDLVPVQPGAVVSFKDGAGFDLAGVVKSLDQSRVVVDFNHPLAGKEIRFRVHIIKVLPPGEQPLEVKL
ncbi:MAG: peptidylprolyl isomerase [Gammaproteobacteria bacterium]